MYLEQRIEELEKQVKLLTSVIDAMQQPLIVVQDQPKAKTPSKQAEEKADNTITAEEVRTVCINLVRANKANKPLVEAILHGKMVREIDPSHYPEIMIELKELEAK